MRLAVPALALVACAACTAQEPAPVASASADGSGALFVANKRDASLSRIDLASGEETHRAETCENPHELTVSPDDAHVLVACYSGTSVEIFAAADLAPVKSIEVGENARVHSAIWHDSGMVVAGAEGRGSIFVIEDPLGEAVLTEIGEGEAGPHMVAVNEAGTLAWGTIIPAGTVVRYDLAAGEEAGRAVLGGQTEALALSPSEDTVWVGSNAEDRVYRLDAETLEETARIATGVTPIRIAAQPQGGYVATSNFGTGDVTVIDTVSGDVARTIPVSGSDDAVQVTLVFSEDGERLYAAETATDTIAEIDFASGEVLRRLEAGPGGDGLAVVD